MTLRFSVLASGSTGNAFYIESKEQRLLVDAGHSGKQMDLLFEKIDIDPKTLTGILVTHEHTDHIKGLGVLARKYNLPIYANERTWKAMEPKLGNLSIDQKFYFSTGDVRTFGDLEIESFGVSHDAAEPMFFIFRKNNKKVTLITDLGYVSEKIKRTIEKSDVFIFEANHDVEMLRMGRYPWNLKRRILSDSGHVSNEECGLALVDVIGNNTERIYLAHLSQDNNMKELARMSVDGILKERGIELPLFDTDPYEPTPLYKVGS